MTNINEVVAEFRKSGIKISDKEVKEVVELCEKKIKLTCQKPEYMELLLPDELRNYCYRKAVNTITLFGEFEREDERCVACV